MALITGTPDDDFLPGTGDPDTISGGAGNDEILGGGGDDTLYGEDGDDIILGQAGADEIHGGAGNDTLIGGFNTGPGPQPGDGADLLDGGEGNDLLRGGDGDDTLLGGNGDDNLRGDGGSDTLDGGAGNDFVSYRFDDFAGPVTVDFRSVTSGVNTISDQRGGTDTVSNFERIGISGSNSDDVLRGSTTLGNQIFGNGGADFITGGAADDLLIRAYPNPLAKIHVAGMERMPNFRGPMLDETDTLDSEAIECEMLTTVDNMLADHPNIGAFLLECSNMPPYAAAIHRHTGKPVFDFVTMINHVAASVRPKTYSGRY